MGGKAAAAYHDVPCDGRCCRQNRHLGVRIHRRVRAYHLREDARTARAEREAEQIADLQRAAERAMTRPR